MGNFIQNQSSSMNLLLLLLIIAILISQVSSTTTCDRSCGKKHVPYPFGFSSACEIRLNCSETGDIFIGEFQVVNVTSESLIVNLPAKCDRLIGTSRSLFNRNYALTWQNGLLLANCSTKHHRCKVPTTTLVETNFELRGCGNNNNMSCFSDEGKSFLSYEMLNQTSCEILFSSISLDLASNKNFSSSESSVSLQFQSLQLGWWLEGSCGGCSENAVCTDIRSPVNRLPGFRCRCSEGFVGDGFVAGTKCRKDSSSCNPSKYMSGRCGGRTRVGVLIGGIVAGAFFMAGLALLCYFIRRRTTTSKSHKYTKRILSAAGGSFSIPFYSYREIEKATNGFSDEQRLGTGAYGTVYAGKFHNDEWVAIKKIRHRDTDGIENVMNEVKLLSSVSHPNLVRLLGCCLEKSEQILVYEFMPNGTLSQHLQREKGPGLPWTYRLKIASETAQAISHLHSAKNPIYHRDIKSSNILLDFSFNSKVADFGLSRVGMTEISHISTCPQGTPGYLDPQYHQNFHLSDKSDVYSFGVVLVEIITAMKVVDFSRPQSEVNLAALAVEKIGKGCMDDIVDPFLEPNRDAWTLSSIHKVAELAFRCLAFHRDMRPSMMEVASEIEYIRQSAWGPLEENNCIPMSTASSCSSPGYGSERSQGLSIKQVVESRRLVLPQRSNNPVVASIEEVKDSSPISVQEPWFSENSSPSSNSLLENVIH